MQFGNQPQVYNDFLDIMKEFKSQRYSEKLWFAIVLYYPTSTYKASLLCNFLFFSFKVLTLQVWSVVFQTCSKDTRNW
jgi:hypothetical protein